MMVVGMIVGALIMLIGVVLGAALSIGARENKENDIEIP